MDITMGKRFAQAVRTPNTDILRMNNQDLNAYIRAQEMENPLIVLKGKREDHPDRQWDLKRKLAWLDEMDEQNRVYYEEELEDEEERDEWNVPVETEESLAEFVFSQLTSLCETPGETEILRRMAESLDDRGYFTEPMEVICSRYGLREVEGYRYLDLLQSAEPAGIGARNLAECLLLQLDRIPDVDPMTKRVVLECLELLGQGEIHRIALQLGISQEEAERCAKQIRRLNPKPGQGFSARENLRYILPDVTVVKFREYFQVMLNDTAYPQIRLDKYYKGLRTQEGIPAETLAYIERHICMARELKEKIRQRGQILTEVTRGIVGLQQEFFLRGSGQRRALTFREAADYLQMPEDTLMTAVQDKYIQCPWGIYPMSYFFTPDANAETAGGETEDVRDMIRRIVAEEEKTRPLSDRKITDLLVERGMKISRRTVSKYRAQLGIPEAGERREWS